MAKISINIKDGSIIKEEVENLIVGIDLGTTNSLVAYITNGRPETIKSETGSHSLVPSIVHFADNGDIIVGEQAKLKLITDPDHTIYSVKRLLGKSYKDVTRDAFSYGYKIIDEQDDTLVKIQVNGKFYTPTELSAEILKELKRIAEKQLGKDVSRAVITVPAYFNDAQRQATRDAGKLAGLEVLRIVNEPTAASLAYDIGTKKGTNEKIAVYDLGGGTFDISILEINDGVFEVLATHGDTFLGGDDIDKAILDHWLKVEAIGKPDFEKDKYLKQSLRLAAEDAKKQLSDSQSFSTEVNGHMLSLSLEDFELLIVPLIERTLDSCRQCIKDSGLSIDEIDQIIMVGGSTRIPFVKKAVSDLFGQSVNDRINPDETVALGAAIQADILSGNRKDMLLLDITPLSLGIETIGGLMDPIIPRNSKIPARAGRQYTTSVDGQKNLRVSIYQGERDLVEDNRKLGEFILTNIPPMAAGMPKIDIQFIIDADGILKVRAKELRSNVETEVEIKSQYGISEEEMAIMLKASLENAQRDLEARNLIEAKNEAQNVLHHSEKFLSQNQTILSDKEIGHFNAHVSALKKAIQTNDKNEINRLMEELNEFSRPLAQRALDHNISEALRGKNI